MPLLVFFLYFLTRVNKNMTQYRKGGEKMSEKWLIKQIEAKQEELKKLLLSKDFDFNDQHVLKLSQELDQLILRYMQYKDKK
jgi:hypothetical protein